MLIYFNRLNAQKSMRRDDDNIVELGTKIMNQWNRPVLENSNNRSGARQLESVSLLLLFTLALI